MDKFRILFVWPNLAKGGGEVALLNLVKSLPNCQITILCYEQINEFEDLPGVDIFYINKPTKNKFNKVINKIKFLIKWLSYTPCYDISIVNEIPFLCMFSWLVMKLTNKRYFLWLHVSRNDIGSPYRGIINQFYKFSIKEAASLIAVSNYCRKSMESFLGHTLKNCEVIPNILLFRPLVDQQTSSLIVNCKQLKIITVGRLSPEKNQLALVKAVNEIIKQQKLQLHLTIVGDGSEYEQIINYINENELESSITMLKSVMNPLPIIKSADIFVLPSLTEALPTVIFEALYCQVPIIATRTGAAEILKDGKYGLLIEPGDQGQLIAALIKLGSSQELRKYYQSLSKEALLPYAPELVIKHWQYLLAKVSS